MDIQRERKRDRQRKRKREAQTKTILERQKEKGIQRQRDEIKNRGNRNREILEDKVNYKERERYLSMKRQTGR